MHEQAGDGAHRPDLWRESPGIAAAHADVRNRLLARLPDEVLDLLRPGMTYVTLDRGVVLFESNVTIEYVYFPEDVLISLVAASPEGRRAEAGLVGHEGMTGLPIVLGDDRTTDRCIVQMAGGGYRVASDVLRATLRHSSILSALMLRYAQAHMIQMSHNVLSNAVHGLSERLARWLLMCHDRIDGDELAVTHETLSIMLGVRRPGVTTTLHVLEGHRLIRSQRRRIVIRDRLGLEKFAADAYGPAEREYRRLIGPML